MSKGLGNPAIFFKPGQWDPRRALVGKSPKLGEVVSVMDLSALEAAAGADDAAPSTDGQRATYFSVSSLARSLYLRWWESGSVGRILPILFTSGEKNAL